MYLVSKFAFTLLLFLSVNSSLHKYYVSVSQVGYSEEDKALQITTRIFIDDMDELLQERYEMPFNLDTQNESPQASKYIEKYLRTKFIVFIDGAKKPFDFLGLKYDGDMLVCYLEVPDVMIHAVKTIAVQNDVLTDLFETQQNIVHFKVDGTRRSFVLRRDDNKGLLKL